MESGLTSNERRSILKEVLRQYNIPESAFSIGSSAEQRVCIEKKGRKYHVYIMERGVIFEESQHITEKSAHLEMLNQLAESKDEYDQMRRTYESLVYMKLAKQARPMNISIQEKGVKGVVKVKVACCGHIHGSKLRYSKVGIKKTEKVSRRWKR